MVLIENVLVVLFLFCGVTNVYVEMLICVGDSVYSHESGSPFNFALPMWLL